MSTRRRFSIVVSAGFNLLCLSCMIISVLVLMLLLWNIFREGWGRLTWELLNNFPSRHPEQAGIKSALWGSLWLLGLTAMIAVPVGVGAAVYLEEYASRNRWRQIIQTNIANLAGVPSVVYGILGLGLFVRTFALGRSLLAGALTLSLVVLPIVILASQEALRAIPRTIRNGSFALGATKWQTTRYQVLPAAMPGIMTGIILALSRALGEAAPLIVVGALAYVPFVPSSINDSFTALPIQIFNWTSRPQEEFHAVAAAGIIVLLIVLVCMNALAVFLRYRFGKRVRW